MQTVLIVGASARAAAQSAARAGLPVAAIDLFGDRDLVELGECATSRDYPRDLAHLAQQFPPARFVYTGGLENHPDVVDALSPRHQLHGNSGDCLRRCRAPAVFQAAARKSGVPGPETAIRAEDLSAGEWLLKPLASAGGQQIRRFTVDPDGDPIGGAPELTGSGFYAQRYVRGETHAGTFLASACGAQLIGVCRQLEAPATNPFRYDGSIGPLSLTEQVGRQWDALGNHLASVFRLRGLFGVDAIFDGESVFPIELNPRYTASIELLERAFDFAAIPAHLQACRATPDGLRRHEGRGVLYGKRIVYSKSDTFVDQTALDFGQRLRQETSSGWPGLADLPARTQELKAGQPLWTVFAGGTSEEEVLAMLTMRADRSLEQCA